MEQLSQPKNVSEQQKDQQSKQNQTAQPGDRDQSKQMQQFYSRSSEPLSAQEGLNLISSLTDVEPPKQTLNQTPIDDTTSRVQKNSKRRGSSSSTGALSDIIQDIRISPREAKMAADNVPTKGIYMVPLNNSVKAIDSVTLILRNLFKVSM